MPPPKDPIKLAEYKEKMRKIALEKGYGKWMLGRSFPIGVLEKMSKSQKALITPEERLKRSIRAKENGNGLWMKGRPSNSGFIKAAKARKGKTYDEIYGEKGKEEKEKRQLSNRGVIHIFKSEEAREKLKSATIRKGKTYEEIYGQVQAEKEKEKRRLTHLKRFINKPRNGCRDKVNGESKYIIWRNSIFKRDNYTCVDCGKIGGTLHAHHIYTWAKNPKLRYRISNGLTLCSICHSKKHPNFKKLILSNS